MHSGSYINLILQALREATGRWGKGGARGLLSGNISNRRGSRHRAGSGGVGQVVGGEGASGSRGSQWGEQVGRAAGDRHGGKGKMSAVATTV